MEPVSPRRRTSHAPHCVNRWNAGQEAQEEPDGAKKNKNKKMVWKHIVGTYLVQMTENR